MDKSKSAGLSEAIERLRRGESVVCLDCGQGEYKTSAKDISDACDFVCDKCGSVILLGKNITVE